MALQRISAETLCLNPFTRIGREGFLLTAGTPAAYNTMTCSWGAMGEVWGNPSVTVYVRTSRYTYDFMEDGGQFSLSFFPEEYKKALAFCGSHSGRDCDKVKATGLTPVNLDGVPAFAEADLVLVCEKVYAQMLETAAFLTPEYADRFYGTDPMHKMYIGRILTAYAAS